MKRQELLFAIVFLLLAAFSCTAEKTPSGSVTPGGMSAPTGLVKAGWRERWDKTVAAAKAEGAAMVYTSVGPNVRAELARDFQSRFGIPLEFVAGSSSDVTSKIVAERRAGLNLADAFLSGPDSALLVLNPAGFLEPLEPVLMLPEVTDPKMWLLGKIPFHNKDRTTVGFLGNHFSHIVVNTEMVKEGQIKSYFDVLKPEWKGKIVMDMPVVNGPGRNWLKLMGGMLNYDLDKVKAYLQQLSAQDPAILRDRRTEMEWVSKGKYAILLGVSTEMYSDFKAVGAPIAYIRLKEGALLTVAPGTISLMKRPAHPNAAIVFVNWLISKEGQMSYIRMLGSPSARLDVPTTGIDPAFLRIPGENVYVDDEEMGLAAEKLVEVARQALAAQLK